MIEPEISGLTDAWRESINFASFPKIAFVQLGSQLLINMVQTNFDVTLKNWLHKKVNVVPICWAISHMRAWILKYLNWLLKQVFQQEIRVEIDKSGISCDSLRNKEKSLSAGNTDWLQLRLCLGRNSRAFELACASGRIGLPEMAEVRVPAQVVDQLDTDVCGTADRVSSTQVLTKPWK